MKRKARFFIALLFIFPVTAFTQQDYKITYAYSYDDAYWPFSLETTPVKLPALVSLLIFNDSNSYCYYMDENGKDPHKKNEIPGKRFLSNSFFLDSRKGVLTMARNLENDKSNYLVKDSVHLPRFDFFEEEKFILGCKCRSAMNIGKNGDTIFVWYAQHIKTPNGPQGIIGLPGLVMEVYYPKTKSRTVAIKIEKGNFPFVPPEKGIVITKREFLILQK